MRVLVFGTFDELHPGHRFLLQEAQQRGELFVVVARNLNVVRIKGKKPVQSEEERLRTIEEVFPDLHLILGDPDDFLVPVRSVRPDLILLGYDQTLPPGVDEAELPCPIERLRAFEPEKYKSSLRRRETWGHRSLR